ncbi:MAG: S8 family serine peptidase, partial [Candidatus Promineifilaceae bacterium]
LDVGTGQVDFIVHLQSQAELPPPLPGRASLERRQAVVAGLRAAAAGQTALGPVLRRLSAAGHVGRQQGLWIVNAILVTGDRAAALALAERPEVARIQLDRRVQLIEPPGPAPRDPDPLRPWGIERVRAPQAWYGLGLDGANVTVAIMDTGVDWLHPDLQPGYRGFNGGEPQHVGNWFDAVGAAPAPIDPYGHGTHVAGTAVGRDGIGVAPGAKWIAVRILDDQGFGTLGSIHQGFEWLLAPAGNPALAPDIVNASWGGHPAALDFLPDVNALRSAGILAIFAAGNGGPAGGSVLAPASYPGALAVGASDDSDEVTWFSSRGPSPHTAEAKPFLVAPGAAVRSSLPGGEYGTANGTSMATPHASGSFALLMQAAPNLGLDALTAVLTATAAPLSQTQPNYVSGWGRLDIYAAAAELVDQGLVSGSLSSQGQPLVGNDVTLTNPAGDTLSFRTGPDGAFQAELLPGLYQLSAEPFGYYPLELSGLAVSASEPLAIDAELVPLPAGYVFGYVEDAAGEPLAAVISAAGTPISTTSQASGAYWLRLPAGAYELTAEALGYRIGRASVSLEAGHTLLRDFGLPAGPRVLLVDSGRWYYGSQAGYFRAALSDAGYAFDELSVRSPHGGAPEPAELEGYDAVVWSAPHDSPGLIAAGDVVSGYLQAGGNLLISGQEIGEQEDLFGSHYWWSAQLQADFLGKEQAPTLLQGVPGTIFEGLSIHLNGPNSAANQVASDRVAPRYSALSRPAARYPGGSAGALEAGLCQPFRMVYLGFGLEGMDGRAGRAALLGRAFDYFAAPRQLAELAFEPPALDETALAGRTLSYTVVVRNLSETLTDTLSLSLAGADWPTAITTPTLTLGPCGAGAAMISVTAPAGLAPDQVEAFEVVARSANDPGLWRSLPVRLEAPAPILLVDDDRWYDQAPVYQGALKANGYDFDFWEIGHFPTGRGSPAPELLEAYDMVLWYTGYDWFEPLTASESQSLADYLAAGGRLFLSSQDYMA